MAEECGDQWEDRHHFKNRADRPSTYFSFITLSTVGYADITPVSRIARWLAAMEAMTGLLYVAVLITRLVPLYSRTI